MAEELLRIRLLPCLPELTAKEEEIKRLEANLVKAHNDISDLREANIQLDSIRLDEVENTIDEQIKNKELQEENAKLKEEVERGGWISVKDRLPDLVNDGEKVLLFRTVNESQRGLQITVHDTFLVKHCEKDSFWQPLPPPPKSK